MDNRIQVSVLCLAYNHEKYIRQCLDGFVNQITDFAFEVLVHDDASTDSTASIIKEYEKKYPNIIKPIYQTENQYSKHQNIIMPLLVSKAQGRYFAWCEGDDFWTDNYKLQKQFDVMAKHPECLMCVAKTQVVNESGSPNGSFIPRKRISKGIIQSNDFLKMTESYCFHTSTFFVNAESYKQYIISPPPYKALAKVGDEVMILYFGSLASVYYLDEIVSCYRSGANGSWSVRYRSSKSNAIQHCENMIAMNECFDEYTNYNFHEACVLRITRQRFLKEQLKGNYRALRSKEYAHILAELPRKKRTYIRCCIIFPRLIPWIFEKAIAMKNKLRKG